MAQRAGLENPETKPHFDVNHYSHVIWEQDLLSDAADELVARIRASIPDAKGRSGPGMAAATG